MFFLIFDIIWMKNVDVFEEVEYYIEEVLFILLYECLD